MQNICTLVCSRAQVDTHLREVVLHEHSCKHSRQGEGKLEVQPKIIRDGEHNEHNEVISCHHHIIGKARGS